MHTSVVRRALKLTSRMLLLETDDDAYIALVPVQDQSRACTTIGTEIGGRHLLPPSRTIEGANTTGEWRGQNKRTERSRITMTSTVPVAVIRCLARDLH